MRRTSASFSRPSLSSTSSGRGLENPSSALTVFWQGTGSRKPRSAARSSRPRLPGKCQPADPSLLRRSRFPPTFVARLHTADHRQFKPSRDRCFERAASGTGRPFAISANSQVTTRPQHTVNFSENPLCFSAHKLITPMLMTASAPPILDRPNISAKTCPELDVIEANRCSRRHAPSTASPLSYKLPPHRRKSRRDGPQRSNQNRPLIPHRRHARPCATVEATMGLLPQRTIPPLRPAMRQPQPHHSSVMSLFELSLHTTPSGFLRGSKRLGVAAGI